MSLHLSPTSLTGPSTNSPPSSRLPSQDSPNPPTATRRPHSSTVTSPPCLLIPTDRYQQELEDKWLPRLGRLKVQREIALQGYSLYCLRNWFLSRTHWSQTIVTQTGKPTEHISVYVLVADPELSEQLGQLEIANATQFLANETHSQVRKIEQGTLLLNTPSAFGQDIFAIPSGDLREAKPFMMVNTGLRRLGCGGRATFGMEAPISAVRRKFIELYRLPTPPNHSLSLSRTASPNTSPSKNIHGISSPNSSALPLAQHPILSDPFTSLVIEMIKLIQAALAIWGMFGTEREDLEINGLFCDETKGGMFRWRRIMGMEHEESMRLEKETSGGCIDPKTLVALLSSITSVRYQLGAVGTDKLPKDPFTSVRRMLNAWRAFHTIRGLDNVQYLSVASVRELHQHYLNERTRSPSDALKVHRFLFHGVASATSSLATNLKGGGAEDAPLRKREHHLRFKAEEDDGESGVGMIIPEGSVGSVAPPDVITSDLDAFTKGILKSREKDWDLMGARRVAELWNGSVAEHPELKMSVSKRVMDGVMMRKRTTSRDIREEEESESGGGPRHALAKITTKSGQAIKGGFGLVSRRNTNNDTSDSETGAGPGPTSLRTALTRRKQNTVPTVIEPDIEEVDYEQDGRSRISLSPSPSISGRHERGSGTALSGQAYLSASRPSTAHRPSIITTMSGDLSDAMSRRSNWDQRSHLDDLWEGDQPGGPVPRPSVAERAMHWHDRGRTTAMLRTSSDGADVVVEEGGNEWEVVNPHGTGKRPGNEPPSLAGWEVGRRHSLQDRLVYKNMRVSAVEHLAVDVDLCFVLLILRGRERELAAKAREMKLLESSIFAASEDIIAVIRSRRSLMNTIEKEGLALQASLAKQSETLEEDEDLQWASQKISYQVMEDANTHDLVANLRALEKQWTKMRSGSEEKTKEVDDKELPKKSWFRLGL